jgi:hypothetical protein
MIEVLPQVYFPPSKDHRALQRVHEVDHQRREKKTFHLKPLQGMLKSCDHLGKQRLHEEKKAEVNCLPEKL